MKNTRTVLDLQRFAKTPEVVTAEPEVVVEDTPTVDQQELTDGQKAVISDLLKSQLEEVEEKHKKELAGFNRSFSEKQKELKGLKDTLKTYEEKNLSVEELDSKRKLEYETMLNEKEAKIEAFQLGAEINNWIADNKIKELSINPKLKDYIKGTDLAAFINNVEGVYENVIIPLVKQELQLRLKDANPVPQSGATKNESGLDIFDLDTFESMKTDSNKIGLNLEKFRRSVEYYAKN